MSTAFNKANLSQIEKEIIFAAQAVAARWGFQIKFKGGRFQPDLAVLKMELFVPSTPGEKPEEKLFKDRCSIFGLKSTDLGRKFKSHNSGKVFTLTGMRAGRSRRKFFGADENGKVFVFQQVDLDFLDAVTQPALA